MTVCVAAICDNAAILAASDRMLTSGDVQFQPPQRKVFHVADNIIGLVAGDFALQTEIFVAIYAAMAKIREDKGANTPFTVKWAADCYAWAYSNIHRMRAAQLILSPLGLTNESFLARQKEMAPSLVEKLANQLIKFDLPETETIFCGVDNLGPHIYVSEDGTIRCEDSVGFAAIGAGSWHAQSQLMFAGYTRLTTLPRSLYQVYAAKKRAETAPGVGGHTDMHYMAPNYISVREDLMQQVDDSYQRVKVGTDALRDTAESEVEGHVQKVIQEAAQAAEANPVPKADDKKPEVEFRPESDAAMGRTDAPPTKKKGGSTKRRGR